MHPDFHVFQPMADPPDPFIFANHFEDPLAIGLLLLTVVEEAWAGHAWLFLEFDKFERHVGDTSVNSCASESSTSA